MGRIVKENFRGQILILFWLIILGQYADSQGQNRIFSPEDTQKIGFSQTGVNPFTTSGLKVNLLANTMRNNNFNWNQPGSKLQIVEMQPGKFASLDNRRLVAAQTAGVSVQGTVHKANDPLPSNQLKRFPGATTYGGAVHQRARSGSFSAASIPNTFTGYPKGDVRIRVRHDSDGNDLGDVKKAGFLVSKYPRNGPYVPNQRTGDFPAVGPSTSAVNANSPKNLLPRQNSMISSSSNSNSGTKTWANIVSGSNSNKQAALGPTRMGQISSVGSNSGHIATSSSGGIGWQISAANPNLDKTASRPASPSRDSPKTWASIARSSNSKTGPSLGMQSGPGSRPASPTRGSSSFSSGGGKAGSFAFGGSSRNGKRA